MTSIERFLLLLRQEGARQNLVASSTLDHLWSRHVVDSAQLLTFAPKLTTWIDLGSGAGFPGLIIAAITDCLVTLVEPRRKRAEFLSDAVDLLDLRKRVTICAARAESVEGGHYDVISARAFAPWERLFAVANRFAGSGTRWLLPKGKGAQAELEAARRTWQGAFRTEPSVTDPHSAIIIAEHVRPKEQR